ncbi:MAG TPA: MFS transporter [Lacunisphaera sp.]|nr:MFS transporter [Lacunisphaera sp.]
MDNRRRSLLLLVVIYLGFISLGLPDGTLGAAWPEVYPELGLPLGMAGTILTVGTLLTALSAFSSGEIIARWRTGPVVLVSGLLTASGVLILSKAQGALWFYGAAIPLGLGAGAVDAGLNGYVAKHYTGRHMNWLHACWGIGATGGPFVIGWALAHGHGWRGGYLAICSIQFSLSLLFLLTLRLWNLVPERAVESPHGSGTRVATTPANSAAGWLSPVIFALYVAVEWTTGLWAGTILVANRGLAPETAALCVAGYWGAVTAGRIAVGFTVERWGNRRTINGGLLLAAVGLVAFALSRQVAVTALALGVTGLGLAPIYPGLMHEVPRRFAPDAVQTIIGRQSGGAAFGSAVLPALAGWVAQSSLEIVPWLAVGALACLIGGIRHLNRIT